MMQLLKSYTLMTVIVLLVIIIKGKSIYFYAYVQSVSALWADVDINIHLSGLTHAAERSRSCICFPSIVVQEMFGDDRPQPAAQKQTPAAGVLPRSIIFVCVIVWLRTESRDSHGKLMFVFVLPLQTPSRQAGQDFWGFGIRPSCIEHT